MNESEYEYWFRKRMEEIPMPVDMGEAHLTEEQYRMLLRMGKDVIWCFDGDNAGIIATKQAVEKMRYKVTQWVIQLPEGADPGNCTSEDLRRYFDEKEKII